MKTTPVVATAVAAASSLVDPSAAFSSRHTTPRPGSTAQQQQRRRREQAGDENKPAAAVEKSSRRDFLGKVSDSAVVVASMATLRGPESANAAIKTGAANAFTGDYDDPNHPGCLRQVKVVGGPLNGSGTRSAFPVIEIVGYDNEKGEPKVCKGRPPSRDYLWEAKGSVRTPTTALVDFSRRGGPIEPLLVKYENGGIVFPDGNKWKKIPEQKDRRPKDMSTLSDGPRFFERDDDDDY